MHAIPEHLGGVLTTRCYTNPHLPYLTLPKVRGKEQVVNAIYRREHTSDKCGRSYRAYLWT